MVRGFEKYLIVDGKSFLNFILCRGNLVFDFFCCVVDMFGVGGFWKEVEVKWDEENEIFIMILVILEVEEERLVLFSSFVSGDVIFR